VYPTQELEDSINNNHPLRMTILVGISFVFLILVFFTYDRFVFTRNLRMLNPVNKTNAIVSSIFPSNVRDRIYADAEEDLKKRGT